jgi:hypothetical protein
MKLLETIDLYKFDSILKTSNEYNLSDILNELRALPYVIIVRTHEDPRLTVRGTEDHTFSLVTIKLLNVDNNIKISINNLKKQIIQGEEKIGKIEGILQFIPIMKSLKKTTK